MSRAMWLGAVSFMGIMGCTAVEDEDMQARNGLPPGCQPDVLYISDVGATDDSSDDFIAQFDATTGEFLGYLEPPGSSFLNGPMGIIVDKNKQVLLGNQNIGEESTGEILVIVPSGNAPPKLLVAPTAEQGAPNPPWIPRGMVLGEHNVLYVADLGDANNAANNGRITLWNSKTGAYLEDLDFTPENSMGFTGWIAPRGIVFGPDGYLYVANTNLGLSNLGGSILRFDPETGDFVNVVYECSIAAAGEADCFLNRPDSVVFGPDGRLYVSSFRADATDVDRILVFDIDEEGVGTPSDEVETIVLDEPGGIRAYAQAILFGPDGALYAPMTYMPISEGADLCSVRKYQLIEEMGDLEWQLECFVPGTKSPLARPFYLTFGETNPSTLAYEPKKQCD